MENCGHYNVELLETIKPVVRILLGALIISSFFFDIACYKFRALREYLMYLEGSILLLLTLVPQAFYIEMKV